MTAAGPHAFDAHAFALASQPVWADAVAWANWIAQNLRDSHPDEPHERLRVRRAANGWWTVYSSTGTITRSPNV